jgi:succinate dehydrogenase / fumarate reductase cytochrome b subunit
MQMNLEQAQTKTYLAQETPLDLLNLRGRSLGMVAFLLNRITGVGLTVYLLLHLVVLSLLAGGEANWDSFINLARSPLFLALDVLLLAGILIHGLNGIRVALVGMGIGVSRQKGVFIGLMVIAALALIFGAMGIFAA